jgi:hypothetical protein
MGCGKPFEGFIDGTTLSHQQRVHIVQIGEHLSLSAAFGRLADSYFELANICRFLLLLEG